MRFPGKTFAVLAAGCLVACGGGGLKLTNVRNAETKPSNVAAYFKVETTKGEPIGGLTADKFKIYEDGELVSEFESKQKILNPDVAASHYTLLLVDMSGSVSESGAIDNVIDAAAAFTERVEKSQKVGVYAFDGCGKLHPLAGFGSAGGAAAAVRSTKGYKPDDPSTDLHGAIVDGIAELDKALSHAENPMRFGTVVVFTDGTDRAGRVKREDMLKAVDETHYDLFAIGLGADMKESELKKIGKDGTAKAENKEEVVKAFENIAQRVEASTKSYYLLSYCSPARAGRHKLKIEAEAPTDDGKSKRSGAFETEFDATGFTKGCDPNTPPNFDIHKGDALKPKDKAEAKDKPEPKPTAAPAPKKEPAKGEVKASGHFGADRDEKPEAKPAPKPAPKPDAKPETKPEAKPEAKPSEQFTP